MALALGAVAALVSLPGGSPPAQAAMNCSFSDGFQAIHAAIPDTVGPCLDSPRAGRGGDVSQRTANGVLVWHHVDNLSAFTDGYRTWVDGPFGLTMRLNTERLPWEADQVGAVVTPVPEPPNASLGGLPFVSQTINNCGPAAVSTALDYWGVVRSQDEIEMSLRADGEAAGMVAFGMPAYLRTLDLAVLMGVEGTNELIQALVANGFPVIVDQWVSPAVSWEHYRVVQAYDRMQRTFTVTDPYLGPGVVIGYDEFRQDWQSDNQRFYVIYPPRKHGLLAAVVARAGWRPTDAFAADAAGSRRRALEDPAGGFGPGYHNLNVAWDELELGDASAAWQALQAAEAQGANAVQIKWIADEIDVRARAKVFWLA